MATAKGLLPAAFLHYYLPGDFVADMADSAGTSWLDVGKRECSDYLLDASNMRRDQMPRLVEGPDAAGTLRPVVAQKWGLKDTITVAGGAGDKLLAPGDVRFLPYLFGERTPHSDAELRAGFAGLSAGTTREDMTRAVLQGVAFGLRDSYDALAATDPSPIRSGR